jgi:hypothetical protein
MSDRIIHPSTGLVPPEEFKKIADSEFYGAADKIRKFDPKYGLVNDPMTKKSWIVNVERSAIEYGSAEIEAETAEEAKSIARKMPAHHFIWDDFETIDHHNFEITDVEECEA